MKIIKDKILKWNEHYNNCRFIRCYNDGASLKNCIWHSGIWEDGFSKNCYWESGIWKSGWYFDYMLNIWKSKKQYENS